MKKYKALDCILLIDDDHVTNFIHTKAIARSQVKAHVKVTESAQEALEFLAASDNVTEFTTSPRPGIILLDINMPGMNGWEFLEEYQKLSAMQKARIIIVMLTTSLNPDDEARAKSNKEVLRFMTKPLRPEMIDEIASQFFELQTEEPQ